MPNFKLGEHYQRTINSRVAETLENFVCGFQNGFPLTHDEVQQCIMDRDTLDKFEALWAISHDAIRRSDNLSCLLTRDVTQGLTRDCSLHLRSTSDDGFFTVKNAQPYGSSPFGADRHRFNVLDVCTLPEERIQAVVGWAHGLIRAQRLRAMALRTVGKVLSRCTSTAHLMANWPELASFANSAEDNTLRKRLAAAPAKLDRYTVSEHLLPPKKQRDAANVVLTMGAMAIPSAKNTDDAEVRGNLTQFETLPTDLVF